MTSIKRHNIELMVLGISIFTKNIFCHMQHIINNWSNERFKAVINFVESIWKNWH